MTNRKMTDAVVVGRSEKPRLLVISSSASKTSRSERLADFVQSLLVIDYAEVEHIRIRDLPISALAEADTGDPAISAAMSKLQRATAVIFVTPTYKGSYSGLFKMFVDILPQYALRGKIVLPLATGGTVAHMQMLDHSLRPVLQTMWPQHIAQGSFILDRLIEVGEGGAGLTDSEVPLLFEVVSAFETMVRCAEFQGAGAPVPA